MKFNSRIFLFVVLITMSGGCAQVGGVSDINKYNAQKKVVVSPSYLKDADEKNTPPYDTGASKEALEGDEDDMASKASLRLESIRWQSHMTAAAPLPTDLFTIDKRLTVTADEMPLRDFIHYVFGQLLSINYVVGESITSDNDTVTLSIVEPISERSLFRVVNELLIERQVEIKFGNETFYLHRHDSAAGDAAQVVIGIGREPSSVPETASRIMQVVPLKFGIKVSLERTLRALTKAKVTPDFEQSAIFIEGRRGEIIRALEFIEMLDTPAMRGRYIGLIDLTFIEPQSFAQQVLVLLENEGIDAAIGRPAQKNLVLVPFQRLGALAIFATNRFMLDRVEYWARLIDVPAEGPGKQYFVYNPRFASAIDLEESISSLLDLKRRGGGNTGGANDGGSTGNAPSALRKGGSVGKDISVVVDEKANLLIFFTDGVRYNSLLPLLSRLDIMPKQVMLDITIAEVSMKNEFKYGVEWALQRGEVNITTAGAFGANEVGGFGLIINGKEGPLTANFLTTNNLVNIISKPTLMVRDGVPASINVGSNIAVVGATTQDPISGERQTTTSEYRKTGVSVSVTPTVNASGIVVMKITQNISNSVPGSSGAGGNPDIFERSIDTEVAARSGQTIMLGGLISENSSSGGSGTPGFSKIPLLGNLFKAKTNSTDRTELVMLITPRVLEDLAGWEFVMQNFRQELEVLDMGGESN